VHAGGLRSPLATIDHASPPPHAIKTQPAPRPWRTSPPFDGLEASLPAGADMDHPLFPVVWPPAL
jgi:hypothetical protein